MMLLLLKVPCILVVTVCQHTCFTAPRQSSGDEHTTASDYGIWGRILQFGRSILTPIKCVFWAIGIAEIATIVAHELLPSDVSRRILSAFMISGRSPQNLQNTTSSIVGLLLIALGTLLRIWCYRTLKNLFTFDVSIRQDHRLVTTGPYSVVRHPSYSGLLAAYIGTGCWYGIRGSWLKESGVMDTIGGKIFFGGFTVYMLGVLVALLKRGTVEDLGLKKTFGKQWEEWARRVPYSYVPGIY